MKISIENNNLVISVPLEQDMYNPFSEKVEGRMKNILGVVEGDDYGFATYIDMSYKGKSPQISPIFCKYLDGGEEDFVKLCHELKIDVYKYPVCHKCGKLLFGAYTMDVECNDVCLDCGFRK